MGCYKNDGFNITEDMNVAKPWVYYYSFSFDFVFTTIFWSLMAVANLQVGHENFSPFQPLSPPINTCLVLYPKRHLSYTFLFFLQSLFSLRLFLFYYPVLFTL